MDFGDLRDQVINEKEDLLMRADLRAHEYRRYAETIE
jgi:hypothetical protein